MGIANCKEINTYMQAGANIVIEMALLLGLTLSAAGFLLLNKMRNESIWPYKENEGDKSGKRVIEIHDYEILDDIQNPPSKGHKVEII